MKKIGIITFHRALNYGGVLQAYALTEKTKSICSKTTKVEIIDYRNAEIEKGRSLKERLKPLSVKNFLRTIMLYSKKKKFDKFISKNLNISTKIYDKNNINEIDNDYDLVITGSDQVWNNKITNNDYTYMLNIKIPKKKKFSYAASIGLNRIDENEIQKYQDSLNDIEYISVRENECLNILKEKLNIKKAEVHLDPTLLLTEKDWKRLTLSSQNKQKYILVYNVPKPDSLYNAAQKISELTGYKLIYIPIKIKPKKGKIVFPDLRQFLTLFSNAEYVITNSFHGTVFAIQFHKKLLVELKKNGTGNDRIKTLLNICNLSDRILDENNLEKIFDEINWNEVDKRLTIHRNKSIEYLKKITK